MSASVFIAHSVDWCRLINPLPSIKQTVFFSHCHANLHTIEVSDKKILKIFATFTILMAVVSLPFRQRVLYEHARVGNDKPQSVLFQFGELFEYFLSQSVLNEHLGSEETVLHNISFLHSSKQMVSSKMMFVCYMLLWRHCLNPGMPVSNRQTVHTYIFYKLVISTIYIADKKLYYISILL